MKGLWIYAKGEEIVFSAYKCLPFSVGCKDLQQINQ